VALLAIAAGLILSSLVTQVAARVWQIDRVAGYVSVDGKANLPTWFGASLLLMAAALLAVIAYTPIKAKPPRRYWLVISAIFVLLSIDKATRVHKGIGEAFYRAGGTEGAFRAAWTLPYGIIGLLLLAAFIPFLLSFLRSFPSRTRNLFLVAGVLYVLSAAGMDALGGELIDSYPPEGWLISLGHIEEGLEMTAVSLFLFGLLDYLRSSALVPEPQAAPPP
jgi:hypothetical protein